MKGHENYSKTDIEDFEELSSHLFWEDNNHYAEVFFLDLGIFSSFNSLRNN